MTFSPAPPPQPSLSAVNQAPVAGTTIALNCTSKDHQVNAYQFYHKSKPLGLPQPSNILNIAVSTQLQQSGDYQCDALIGNIKSVQYSNSVSINGKLNDQELF